MNTAFNSALKQRTAIRRDLAALSDQADPTAPGAGPQQQQQQQQQQQPPARLTPAALGSLSASLAAFSRTVDDYHALAKQELDRAKQEKALERIRDFRAELAEFRARLDALKAARDEAAHADHRAELLGRRPFAAATPENPYAAGARGEAAAAAASSSSSSTSATGYGLARGHARTTSMAERAAGAGAGYGQQAGLMGGGGGGGDDMAREAHALREQRFFASAHSALDDYIARGQAVLGDLGQQREMLKSTQRRLYSVGNTLGISGDTIRMIERRARQDTWVFGGGVVVFFLFCWLVLHYLR